HRSSGRQGACAGLRAVELLGRRRRVGQGPVRGLRRRGAAAGGRFGRTLPGRGAALGAGREGGPPPGPKGGVSMGLMSFGLPGLGLSLIISVLLCVHVVRTHRELYWLWIILLFQPLGGLVYLIAI